MADAADLKAVFPAFAAVADETITYWLDRAARTVDASWPEDDQDHAQMLLAAHLLTQQGAGAGAEAQAFAAGAAGFKSMRSGALSLDRFDTTAGGSDLETTSYGKQFRALLRAVKGGPRVTGTGTLPGYVGRLPGW